LQPTDLNPNTVITACAGMTAGRGSAILKTPELCYYRHMNYQAQPSRNLRPPGVPLTTQAAEGLPRRVWTVDEIMAMVEAGIIAEDERFELIDGEVVPMSPKGNRHEMIKASLLEYWILHKPNTVRIVPETTFRLNASSFLEPDFVFFASTTKLKDLTPANALLAVEISDSTLRYDTGRKAKLYASHGVTELWAIDTETLQTHIFTKPSAEGYLERHLIEPDQVLAPTFAPEIAVKLGELPLL
jgi:Uma2 family endonuclease